MDDEDLTDVATAAEMAGFTAGPPTLEFVAPDDDGGNDEDVAPDSTWDFDESASVIIETLPVPEPSEDEGVAAEDVEFAESPGDVNAEPGKLAEPPPAGDEQADGNAMARASALAASWIPRSPSVRTSEGGSVFGTRAGAPVEAMPEAVVETTGAEDDGEPGEDEMFLDAAAPAAPATDDAAGDENALADDLGPPETSVREDAEDVPAEDIQVESLEPDEERWWIEPDEADRQADQVDDVESSSPSAIAPRGTSAGPTPDPRFLTELLGRMQARATPEPPEPDPARPPEPDALPEPEVELEVAPRSDPERAREGDGPAATPEPGPVDAIAASFGSWVPSERRREFQPPSAAERPADAEPEAEGGSAREDVSVWAAWPEPPHPEEADDADRLDQAAWPQSGLVAPTMPAPTAAAETPSADPLYADASSADAPSADAPSDRPEGSVPSRHDAPAGGVRTLAVMGAEGSAQPQYDVLPSKADASTALPPDATPEARLRAQLRQRAANASGTSSGPSASGDVWLLTGEPDRVAGDASARSPVLSLVLTGIAVLIVVVIVIGVLYMFNIL
jgi:hypothetical protein